MAPILCVVAVEMEADMTIKITRHFFRGMAPILFVVAVNVTSLLEPKDVQILPTVIDDFSSVCDSAV
jgi:hypothetical protein